MTQKIEQGKIGYRIRELESATQPTKRERIDALVQAEYDEGLYDRLPEIEHNDH